MIKGHQLSERSACQLAGISRTAYGYRARPKNDNLLRAWLKLLAVELFAYGYLLLLGMLNAYSGERER